MAFWCLYTKLTMFEAGKMWHFKQPKENSTNNNTLNTLSVSENSQIIFLSINNDYVISIQQLCHCY